jgi:hypothetical protein
MCDRLKLNLGSFCHFDEERHLRKAPQIFHHRAILSADRWPDHVPVPTFGPRMVCTRCGIVGADVRRTGGSGSVSVDGLAIRGASQMPAIPESRAHGRGPALYLRGRPGRSAAASAS